MVDPRIQRLRRRIRQLKEERDTEMKRCISVLYPLTKWAGCMPGEVHENYAKRIEELIRNER